MARHQIIIDHTHTATALLERINAVIVLARDIAPPTEINTRRIAEARHALKNIAGFFDIDVPGSEAI